MTNGLGKIFTAYIENNKKYDYEIGLAVERMGLKSLNIIFEKQAADRIEKLEAEVKRLIKSRNKWGKLYNQTLEKLRLSVMSDSEYVKIIDEKCAEQASRIEQLEAALREIIDIHPFKNPEGNVSIKSLVDLVFHINLTARKALEGKDDGRSCEAAAG